jgi:hypothetical protein
MKIAPALALAAAALSAGCSTTQRYYLDGRSMAEFQQADRQCTELAAGQINQGLLSDSAGWAGQGLGSGYNPLVAIGAMGMAFEATVYESRRKDCMRQLGYRPAN